MNPGSVVEYAVADGHRLGAVLDVIGKTKLLVLTATGDENRPTFDDISFTLTGCFGTHDRGAALDAVQRLERELESLTGTLDVADIWSSAGGGRSYEIDELARVSGHPAGLAHIAVARVLRGDDVYFRHRKGRFEARSIEQVEERLRQLEFAVSRDAQRATFVARLAEILALPSEERADRFRRAEQTDPEFEEWAELLRGFAADEAEFARREEVDAVLDDITQASGLRLSARAAPRGFELMLELGLWTEHENLAMHHFGLLDRHDDATRELAAAAAAAGFDREGREDFTGWWSLTIDDIDAHDFDDGLSIRPTLDGGWEVAIHIADPDAYAPKGSALDKAARQRGSSIYLSDGAIGMFPLELSADAMSLMQDVDRPGLTTHVLFDADLEIVEWRFAPSVVRMNRRLTYDEVDAALLSNSTDHTTSVLRDLAFIADELHARRLARGARPIELPEPHVRVAFEDGDAHIELRIQEPSTARNLVAEFMVLAGELTARWCTDHNVPIIYRTQDPPGAERDDPEIQHVPEGWAREFALLMTMRRGDLTTNPGAHAALGLDRYAQATSPIRRYGDLVLQRQLKAALRGDELPYDMHDLYRVAQRIERANHETSMAERESEEYWILEHLRRREGEEVDVMVVAARDETGRRAEVILLDCGFRTQVRFRTRPELGSTVRLRIDRARCRPPVLTLEEL